MKKGISIILMVLLIIFGIGGINLWNHRNKAVDLEERIEAQYTSNKSNYDAMWKSFKEMTQVTELQANQFKELYTDLISGRYENTDLLFQAVQEQNPQLDTAVYTELQREISNGRKTFDNNQSKVVDIIREYNSYIKKHPIMKAITGREVKDSNEYIVTSERTDNAFNDKKDEKINLLNK